jgi:hypothetical protein
MEELPKLMLSVQLNSHESLLITTALCGMRAYVSGEQEKFQMFVNEFAEFAGEDHEELTLLMSKMQNKVSKLLDIYRV